MNIKKLQRLVQETYYFQILNKKNQFKLLDSFYGINRDSFNLNIMDIQRVQENCNRYKRNDSNIILFKKNGYALPVPIYTINDLYSFHESRCKVTIMTDLLNILGLKINDICNINNIKNVYGIFNYIRYKKLEQLKENESDEIILKQEYERKCVDGFINTVRIAYDMTVDEFIESDEQLQKTYDDFMNLDFKYNIDSDISNIYTELYNKSALIDGLDMSYNEIQLKKTILPKYVYFDNINNIYIKEKDIPSAVLRDLLNSLHIISEIMYKFDNNVDRLNKFYDDNKYKIPVLSDILIMAYVSPYIAEDLDITDFIKSNKYFKRNINILTGLNKTLEKIYNKVK